MLGPRQKTEWEIQLQVFTAVITNLIMLPGSVMLWKQKRYPEFFVGTSTFVCSFVYHYLDTVGGTFLEMNDLRWHKLDNIFAITSFCYLVIMLTQYSDIRKEQRAQYAFFCVVVMLQECSPWNELFTFLPILAAFCVFAYERLSMGTWPALDQSHLKKALVFLVLAIFCFVRGLDDQNDWLRLFHGLWHSFVGLFTMFMILANGRFTAKRNAHLQKLALEENKFTI